MTWGSEHGEKECGESDNHIDLIELLLLVEGSLPIMDPISMNFKTSVLLEKIIGRIRRGVRIFQVPRT